MIVVGGSDLSKKRAFFSNYGTGSVNIAAP
jgi:hypothetical protein